MRRTFTLLAATIALSALLYTAVTGWLLAGATLRILTVGHLAGALAEAERPGDPLELGFRGDPGQALGLPFEALDIPTPLGPAPAWLVGAEGATGPLGAIYVHGIGGAREDGYRHLTLLHEAGIPTLLISYRNDAGAAAAPEGIHAFGLTEWPDLEAAAQVMLDQGHDRLLAVADSMGGAVLGQFLARSPLAGRVAAVALDAPAVDFRGVLAHLARQRGLPLSWTISGAAEIFLAWRGPLDLGPARVADTFAAFPGPLFVAHGSADRIVPVAGSTALAARRTAPTVTLFTAGDHLRAWHTDPAAYRAAFAEFLALLPS